MLRAALLFGCRAPALPGPFTMFLLLPFDSLVVNLLGISITVLFTLLLVFIIVPAIFGVSFGIRKVYMKTLLKIFQVSHIFRMFCVFAEVCPTVVMKGGEAFTSEGHCGCLVWGAGLWMSCSCQSTSSAHLSQVHFTRLLFVGCFFPVINLQVKQ